MIAITENDRRTKEMENNTKEKIAKFQDLKMRLRDFRETKKQNKSRKNVFLYITDKVARKS